MILASPVLKLLESLVIEDGWEAKNSTSFCSVSVSVVSDTWIFLGGGAPSSSSSSSERAAPDVTVADGLGL